MEKDEIVKLANEFMKKIREQDDSVRSVFIAFNDEDAGNNEKIRLNRAAFLKLQGELPDIQAGCRYIEGLGVVCGVG